jgi:hypothetical protein
MGEDSALHGEVIPAADGDTSRPDFHCRLVVI